MNKRIKERIFGAVVLVSLATIFLPMIFSGDQEIGDLNLSDKIPTMPVMEKGKPKVPSELSQWQDKLTETKNFLEQDDTTQPKPAFGSLEPIEAWAIQVASFQKGSNAEQLRVKLLNEGFPAYIKKFEKNSNDMIYQVMIGPEIDKLEAEKKLSKVNDQFHVKGMIVKYQPVSLKRST